MSHVRKVCNAHTHFLIISRLDTQRLRGSDSQGRVFRDSLSKSTISASKRIISAPEWRVSSEWIFVHADEAIQPSPSVVRADASPVLQLGSPDDAPMSRGVWLMAPKAFGTGRCAHAGKGGTACGVGVSISARPWADCKRLGEGDAANVDRVKS
eukprot:scaffold202519_cov26-Tisochrysis_lutea.AAC.1